MKNSIRLSFAAKLRSAQDLLANIKEFEGYDPPRPEESVVGFQAQIDSIIASNQAESAAVRDYRLLVKERQEIFFLNSDSIVKMFPVLKEIIKSQYGSKSGEVAILRTIVNKMRSTKSGVVGPVANATDTSNQERSIRQSEKSFAAMTKNFNDFITVMEGFVDFKPAQEAFKIETLKRTAQSLTEMNDSIAQKINQLTNVRFERQQKYIELSNRFQRIKSFIRAHYGVGSPEYKIAMGFRI